jgi:hypothetical protein
MATPDLGPRASAPGRLAGAPPRRSTAKNKPLGVNGNYGDFRGAAPLTRVCSAGPAGIGYSGLRSFIGRKA